MTKKEIDTLIQRKCIVSTVKSKVRGRGEEAFRLVLFALTEGELLALESSVNNGRPTQVADDVAAYLNNAIEEAKNQ